MRWGARLAVVFAILVITGIGVTAGAESAETRGRLLFVFGAAASAMVFVLLDFFVADHFVQYVVDNPETFGFDRQAV